MSGPDRSTTINNPASNADENTRRSGASENDPHGGHEHMQSEWRGPDADPVDELVPGGQGAEPRSQQAAAEHILTLDQAGHQPGFGPGELYKPTLGEGNPDIGPDPSDTVADQNPTDTVGLRREGMLEAGARKG